VRSLLYARGLDFAQKVQQSHTSRSDVLYSAAFKAGNLELLPGCFLVDYPIYLVVAISSDRSREKKSRVTVLKDRCGLFRQKALGEPVANIW